MDQEPPPRKRLTPIGGRDGREWNSGFAGETAMSETTVYTCDRCGARHEDDRPPQNWHTNVKVWVGGDNLPTYSVFTVDERWQHLCYECTSKISNAVKGAISND